MVNEEHNATSPDPLAGLLDELREYASYYFDVRADQAKLKLRRVLIGAVIGAAGVTVLLALLATTTTLLLAGVAGGLAEALGGRVWLGNFATGGGVLLIGAMGLLIARWYVRRSGFKQTAAKYAQRRAQQRQRFGRDISRRADTAN